MVLGANRMVHSTDEVMRNIWMGIAGGGFVLSPIIFALIGDYKANLKFSPIKFKKKGNLLFVQIKNKEYERQFTSINKELINNY